MNELEARSRPSRAPIWPLRASGWLLALLAHSCSLGVRVEPVPREASAALSDARAHLRADEPDRGAEAARRALGLAPDWIAPERLLDDVARARLLAGEALERRLVALRGTPSDAGLLYLVGRLEGAGGLERMERAASLAPALAWPHHGLAWLRFQAGDARGALGPGRLALARARDPWEHAFFAQALARYMLVLEKREEALEVLREALRQPLEPFDHDQLAAELASFELLSDEDGARQRGFGRALEVLSSPLVDQPLLEALVDAALDARGSLGEELVLASLEATLGARDDEAARRVRASLVRARGAEAFARALERSVPRPEDAIQDAIASSARAARLALGEGGAVVEDWLATLPARVLDEQGLPRDPRLAHLVRSARSGEGAFALGEALLAAGWFTEARGLAESLAPADVERAASIDARAAAGRALLTGILRVLQGVDRGEELQGRWSRMAPAADPSSPPDEEEGRRVESLQELLAALQVLFDRFHGAERAGEDLAGSPTLRFGPIAELVHPGPEFSMDDEGAGLGARGTPVSGLAHELASIGRFGIFGEALGGGGPDGTVLRLLLAERREGVHLGVPFSGTVAWCEGTDVPSRPVRRGANITGAALHEGYWIDVAGVRRELGRWRELAQLFPPQTGERERALAARGPLVEHAGGAWRARRKLYAAEGEGDRVRLAVLEERDRAGVGAPELEELLDVVAVHEEGHLCDRGRFLPLSRNLGAILRLFFESGLSPLGVGRRLEYRAQLVALCVAVDPRLPLAECLDGVGVTSSGTPHAAAYRDLLADLVEVLDEALEAGDPGARALDPEHYLVHQLHLLGPEDVRSAALRLAQSQGLRRDG